MAEYRAERSAFPTEMPAFHRRLACVYARSLVFSKSCSREHRNKLKELQKRLACAILKKLSVRQWSLPVVLFRACPIKGKWEAGSLGQVRLGSLPLSRCRESLERTSPLQDPEAYASARLRARAFCRLFFENLRCAELRAFSFGLRELPVSKKFKFDVDTNRML